MSRPCFAEIDPESAEPFHCHRIESHTGPHADWSPEECLVKGCDCTAEYLYECAECGHLHWTGAKYIECDVEGCDCEGQP